ncbi:MAG: nuclear transport factor 2 family protein [Gemmataceae bacterium]
MSDVRLHPVSESNFIERLHLAFAEGDAAVAHKVEEAGNVRQLQESYRALARGDFGPTFAMLHDDVEMQFFGPPGAPIAGKWSGRPMVAEAIQRNFGQLEEQRAEVLSLVAQGDTVVVVGHETGRVRATGQPYDWHWVQQFTFRDGRVVRFRGLCADSTTG